MYAEIKAPQQQSSPRAFPFCVLAGRVVPFEERMRAAKGGLSLRVTRRKSPRVCPLCASARVNRNRGAHWKFRPGSLRGFLAPMLRRLCRFGRGGDASGRFVRPVTADQALVVSVCMICKIGVFVGCVLFEIF